jgi:GAF domain-containing protein
MFKPLEIEGTDCITYEEVLQQLTSLIIESDTTFLGKMASLANASALLAYYVKDINWIGFYLVSTEHEENRLILGPFQGSPACVSIAKGSGVCGTAWQQRKTQVVADVLQFPGHIACDAASRSEIVVPLFSHNTVVGVLDVDSPFVDHFTDEDVAFLEQASLIVSRIFPD